MSLPRSRRRLSEDERDALWKRASQCLALVDVEPPVSMNDVDALLQAVGRQQPNQTLEAWLCSIAGTTSSSSKPGAKIAFLDRYHQRFRPIAEFVRLAADSSGCELPLPTHPLETDDGRFRLSCVQYNGELKVEVQALGQASSDWAKQTMVLAGLGEGEPALAIFELDDDGDACVFLPDLQDVRQALLRPMLGQIDKH